MLFLGGTVDAVIRGDVAGDVGILPGPSVGFVRGENIEGKGAMSGRMKRLGCRIMEKLKSQGTRDEMGTYSNCKAAILLGKPVTKHVISHGRSESRDVLTAPPLDSPLCCLRRRTGLGVLPT